jgi:cold shock protein
MALGKVVKFDEARGFGFIAPMGGNEDVFLHVNDLLIPEAFVRPGTMLEFDIDEGERGLKAFNISLAENDPRPVALARTTAAAVARVSEATLAASTAASAPAASTAASAPAASTAASVPPTAPAASSLPAADGDGDEFCDLLTVSELSVQVTELLLAIVPPLTGEQVLTIRSRLTEFARDRGWLMS